METFQFELHSLAHDLKSPLSTVIGLGELLQMRLNPSLAKETEYATTIQRVGQRLVSQIDRLLNLNKYRQKQVNRQKINLSMTVKQIVAELQTQQPDRKVHMDIEENLFGYADQELIRVVLENLISNVFKYSRNKEVTYLRFARVNGLSPSFVIEDRGEGFDPAKADRLFKPFTRLHDESEFEGSGLGLASVAKIIELHGGTVWAESIPNEGARFHFHLPELQLEAAQ